ncbi:hypothetical protein CBG04_08520 [Limosilactobacillus reuteri]|uniref:Metallo-beta-lactamase domain-containing protein n=1 Tax=Limosilactobacillus reuteri TaxID=1598 RepID=A0AB73Q5U5_LIMRT|nr:MBL fold metallo-hydrolase [Limosilactobacillus reuteri]MCC4367790.1 MBL fold metallo-hydrolase [Limosilactobacillus reuteri]OYS82423.1 hypothetical protein CBG04_08520 [Limosilactobacillus reuteri]OYS83076.1 hypothetical protein CBG11_00755 [Limosilactobacillus reuteri]OYS83119.1 hypothetical protein CBG14_08800 [Limosilactobacillus reuteri]OYS87317.1 hypothetical protein CBG19_05110 [Limosilactobacillus reuteri]
MTKIIQLKYGNTKCYLLKGTKKNLLIDADWAGTLPKFFQELGRKKLKVQDIDYLLITHYHPDHMGLATDLMNLGISLVVLDCQMAYIHQSDYIFQKEHNPDFQPINYKHIHKLNLVDSRHFLSDCGISGIILSSPGHSADSISLVLDSGEAFVGDLYPQEQVPLYNNKVLSHSWKKLISHGANFIYFAHYANEKVI